MFEKCIDFVLAEEGGYVDSPLDPGGRTKYGISARAYPNVNIKELTIERASNIYKQDYWDRCRCDELPLPIALLVFDTAVNQGPEIAVKLLQTSLGILIDGLIGPTTLQQAAAVPVIDLIMEFVSRRLYRYGLNNQFQEYGMGWTRRTIRAYEKAMELR